MKLRDYQQRSVAWIEGNFGSGSQRILLVAPTGAGKTRMFLELCKRYRRCLALVPWRSLVNQTIGFAKVLGLDARPIRGSSIPDGGSLHVATVQTAIRRDLGQYDLVVIDEARGVVTSRWDPLIEQFSRSKILGCDATPERLDGSPLSRVFDELYESVTFAELVRRGYLVPLTIYGPDSPIDTSSIAWSSRSRDWSPSSAHKEIARRPIVGDAIDHWRRLAQGRRTFIYCCTRQHAREIAEEWTKAGIPTEAIDGTTGIRAREETLERLRSKQLQCVANVAILTEGIDFPELEAEVILRPTASRSLWLQIIGRSARTANGKKDAIILDHAGNTLRLGFPTDDHQWSLEGRKNPTPLELESSEPKAFRCRGCGRLIPAGEHCDVCGILAIEAVPETIPGNLRRLTETNRLISW